MYFFGAEEDFFFCLCLRSVFYPRLGDGHCDIEDVSQRHVFGVDFFACVEVVDYRPRLVFKFVFEKTVVLVPELAFKA